MESTGNEETSEEKGDDSEFKKWLESVAERFETLSPKNRSTTFYTLIHGSSPEQRYQLLKDISGILHQDIITLLPTELQEHICDYIDPKSLLAACNVSKSWNGIISSLNNVWRNKCLALGIGSVDHEVANWKSECVITLRLFEGICNSTAFEHQDVKACYLTLEQISAVDYCNGYLVGCAENKVGLWRTSDYELVNIFSVNHRIVCVCIHNAKFLAFGHSTGHVSVWSLNLQNGYSDAEECHEYMGHVGVVMSITLDATLKLVASGATDFTAKLWSLKTGCLLKAIALHGHWVIQVTLLPAKGSRNPKTLFKGKHSLLTKTRDHIRIYSWPTDNAEGNPQGDLSAVHNPDIEIPMNAVDNFFTPGCWVHSGKVVYVRQTLVQDCDGGDAEIVVECLATRACLQKVHLRRKVRKLLAVGDQFALILLPHSHIDKFNMIVVDLIAGEVVGGCHLPYSRSATPNLAQITVGNTTWMNGLAQHHPDELILALGIDGGLIRIITWNDVTQSCTG